LDLGSLNNDRRHVRVIFEPEGLVWRAVCALVAGPLARGAPRDGRRGCARHRRAGSASRFARLRTRVAAGPDESPAPFTQPWSRVSPQRRLTGRATAQCAPSLCGRGEAFLRMARRRSQCAAWTSSSRHDLDHT
jgi:hypothetical protein